MSAQPALKYIYLPAIAAASISGLISVAGSYLMSKRINDTLARHERLLEHRGGLLERCGGLLERRGELLEHQGKLLQETNEKLDEIQRMLRKKTRCFLC
jgi:hypothetical protein